MPTMIPYVTPYYFIILAIALAPMAVCLIRGKRPGWYQVIITVFLLYISFGGENYRQGLALIGYAVWQTMILRIYFGYRQKNNKSAIFYLTVLLAILPLCITKLYPVIMHENSLLAFLGISYLTFKSIQMVMEIRDGVITEYKNSDYIKFLLFFPTISSGPIDRFRRFKEDSDKIPDKDEYLKLLDKGIFYIFLGFLYKFILGHLLGNLLLPIVTSTAMDHGIMTIWTIAYMYNYSFYLFFDFAGYSLFAVGTSYIMGYRTPMNFNKPFISPNIKEFWNRWHMSLSTWFRDYVYMRLMFTLIKKQIFKSRVIASNIGYYALFLLMGLWHGLTWYYILYGLYHATLICLNDAWIRYKKKHSENLPSNRITKGISIILTFNVVCFSFLIFSGYFDLFLN